MSRIRIIGNGGVRNLEGEITIQGSKNSIMAAFAMTLVFKDTMRIDNVPDLGDTDSFLLTFEELGITSKRNEGSVHFNIPKKLSSSVLPSVETKKTRGIIAMTGPLLARTGVCNIPGSGSDCGCAIGARPIDMYLSFFGLMGATITYKDGEIECNMKGNLKGSDFTFRKKTVLGTVTAVLSSVLAKGETTLRNCAIEPEIIAVLEHLKENGAEIEGIGTNKLIIQGRDGELLEQKTPFENIPDRIESISFILLAILAARRMKINNVNPKHFEAFLEQIKQLEIEGINVGDDFVEVSNPSLFDGIKNLDIQTKEHPGFPTDAQTMMMVLASQIPGKHKIVENIFEDRIKTQANILNNFGAEIYAETERKALITGGTKLHGAKVSVSDLRTGFALIIASAIAEGESIIGSINHIRRGYENIIPRLQSIGMNIKEIV